MIIQIPKGWIFVIGYKIMRTSLNLKHDKLAILWELLSSIAPYATLKFQKNTCIVLVTIFDYNLDSLEVKSNEILHQIRTIVSTHTSIGSGFEMVQFLISNSMTAFEQTDRNFNKFNLQSSYEIIELQKIHFPISLKGEITFKLCDNGMIKLPNEEYKTLLSFKKIKIRGGFGNTLKSLINNNISLIIASEKLGFRQFLTLEITSNTIVELMKTQDYIFEMLQLNPRLTGNLVQLNTNYINRNKVLSNLGISQTPIKNNIIGNIINKIPENLAYKIRN